ncbi:MAG: hypothetical protein BWY57_01483 [Betaproteobacteria bacterium ADurb.Bin341]|nr:MAG: hypothetical protein BWY57_01483 [Betaproteobacteria bacterium ADurb.Bin341]
MPIIRTIAFVAILMKSSALFGQDKDMQSLHSQWTDCVVFFDFLSKSNDEQRSKLFKGLSFALSLDVAQSIPEDERNAKYKNSAQIIGKSILEAKQDGKEQEFIERQTSVCLGVLKNAMKSSFKKKSSDSNESSTPMTPK